MSFGVVYGAAAATLLLSWFYFRRFRVGRPPLGVVNLWDVLFVGSAIVLVPYLYLSLPLWAVATLLCLAALSVLYFTLEPVVRRPLALGLALLLAGSDIALAVVTRAHPMSAPFLAINDAVLVMLIVGVANLWAQGGLKARDAVLLAGGLALYDLIATGLLPLTGNLLVRLASLPFQPMLAWPRGPGVTWLGIGMGDLLLSSIFPLVMRKAFSRAAGVVALSASLAAIGLLLELPGLRAAARPFPVMVALGPLMVVQYLYWRWRRGPERRMWEYLREDPPVPMGNWSPRLHSLWSP